MSVFCCYCCYLLLFLLLLLFFHSFAIQLSELRIILNSRAKNWLRKLFKRCIELFCGFDKAFNECVNVYIYKSVKCGTTCSGVLVGKK